MATMIFVNLPVRDLQKSMAFYSAVGFRNEPKFTDATAACMVYSEHIFVMLLTEEKFRTFTPKAICDARSHSEMLVSLSLDSRAAVDERVQTAVKAGGSTYADPKDLGFMYQHGYQDPDGHIWEIFWMDPVAAEKGCAESAAATAQ